MGGVLGRANQSVACAAPSLSYGLSRIDDRLPLKYITPAHEIAHNLGATHADQNPECVGSIMRPTTTSQFSFCQFSRTEIAQYISHYGYCLTNPASNPSISGQVADVSGKPIGGVMVLAVGSTFKQAQTDSAGHYLLGDLMPGGSYMVTPSKQNYAFIPERLTFNQITSKQVANFIVKNSPDGPVLVTAQNSNRAIALDSVNQLRDPLPILTLHNLSPDKRTRVLLFAYNAALMPAEDVSAVNAQAEDAFGHIYPLAVESIVPIPALPWLSQITVKLPNELITEGDVLVTISLRGATSNRVSISIAASSSAIVP